jgi:hypothetical protein
LTTPSWTVFGTPAETNTGTTQFPSSGDWYVTCQAYDDHEHWCTANPWCPWEPNPPDSLACAFDPPAVDCNDSTSTADGLDGSDWRRVSVYQAPAAPVNTTSGGLKCDASNLTMSFRDVSGAATYRYRADWSPDSLTCGDGHDRCGTVADVAGITDYILITNVENCSTYDTFMQAGNTANPSACEWSALSNEVRVWTDATPAAPTNLSPIADVCTPTPVLSWTAPSVCDAADLDFLLRFNDQINGWSGSCAAPNAGADPGGEGSHAQ